MKNIIVIYHKNCTDGIGGAWVAYKVFGKNAEYLACEDWKVLPEYVSSHKNLSEAEIYIIDFSFEKNTLLELESKCKKLVILDHHIGAKEAILSVKNNMYGEKDSGCMLAWKYFFPNVQVPKIIQYVSDSDTWTHDMPDYKYINAYIYRSDKGLTLEDFDKTALELENNFEEVRAIGKILREAFEGNVNKYIERAQLVNFCGHEIYVVNAPSEIKSELGHELASKTNSFSVVYYYHESKWRFSMRSVKDFDVSEIAKRYGGGGHKNAAAFHYFDANPFLNIINKIHV